MHMDNREIVWQMHDGCVMVDTRIFLGNLYVYTKLRTECYYLFCVTTGSLCCDDEILWAHRTMQH